MKKLKAKSLILLTTLILTTTIPQSVGFAVTANPSDDYLHTSGGKIVDDAGNQVRLTGIAWFGFETPNYSFHGIWANTPKGILDTAADRGFNLIRVPMSVELVNQWRQGIYPMPDSMNDYLNPNMEGFNSLQVLDYVINYSKEVGLKIMLDMHRILSSGQLATWYTSKYTSEDFEKCWVWLAERYKNDDTVIAFDLFNEPHGKPYQAELGAKWDGSTDENNWKYEAEKVGKLIQKVNPKLLLMVEGVEAYPKEGFTYDTKDKNNYYGSWWGGNLRGAGEYPVTLDVNKNAVVYSPHDYGPSVSDQPWFAGAFTEETLTKDTWEPNWFYLQEKNIAPLLIGEWGGMMDAGINQKWMSLLAGFIAKNDISHTFWCLNPNSGDTGGILGQDFKTVDEAKMALVEPTLWKDATSKKYIGLDHQVNLGKNGTHVIAPPPKPLAGDINNDGKISLIDYVLMKRYMLKKTTTIDITRADTNNDGKVDATDLIQIKKVILGSN